MHSPILILDFPPRTRLRKIFYAWPNRVDFFFIENLGEAQGGRKTSLPCRTIFGAKIAKFKFFLTGAPFWRAYSSIYAQPIWMSFRLYSSNIFLLAQPQSAMSNRGPNLDFLISANLKNRYIFLGQARTPCFFSTHRNAKWAPPTSKFSWTSLPSHLHPRLGLPLSTKTMFFCSHVSSLSTSFQYNTLTTGIKRMVTTTQKDSLRFRLFLRYSAILWRLT